MSSFDEWDLAGRHMASGFHQSGPFADTRPYLNPTVT